MDIKEILKKEFEIDLNSCKNNKSLIPDSKSLSIDGFTNNYRKYKKSLSSKISSYENAKKESIKLYKSRLNFEKIFAEDDIIYNESKKKLAANDLYGAYCGFKSISGHRDSDILCKECEDKLDGKYNEAISLFNQQLFNDAKIIFNTIIDYKDSKNFISKCNESIKLAKKKEQIYNSSINSFNNKDYYDAFMGFYSILDYKDSKEYYKKADLHLNEKYSEAMNLYSLSKYAEALTIFKILKAYKDTEKMIKNCEAAISNLIRQEKENEYRMVREAARKKKKRIFIISSFSFVSIVILALVLAFTVFIPRVKEEKYNSALILLESGNFSDAASQFENLNFKDSNEKFLLANACCAFESGNYNSGIQDFCKANGTINVSYNANGGTCSRSTEIISTSKTVDNIATKDYYTFAGWRINGFSVNTKENSPICNLNLIADYELTEYSISYNLNGGNNNSQNPTFYTYESSTINLANPTKEGYNFTGWTMSGSNSVISINKGSHGNIDLTANWSPCVYNVSLDSNGGTISGNRIYSVEYNSYVNFPIPQKEDCTFEGWYYNDEKIGPKWTFTSGCTITARWKPAVLSYLTYTTTNVEFSYEDSFYENYLIVAKGLKITGIKDGYSGKSIIIPEQINGVDVVEIAEGAFKNASCSSNITCVEIPNSVVKIGAGALANFSNLEKLTIPFAGEVKKQNCGTKAVFGHIFGTEYPNTTQKCWRAKAYGHDDGSIDYYIPQKLTEVKVTGDYFSPCDFSNCSNIKIIIPNSETTYIGDYAFYGCKNLESFNMLDFSKLLKVGNHAFDGLTKLNDVCLPSSVTSLGEFAFKGTGIQSVSLSSSITRLPNGVFKECTEITSFTIPSTVSYIGDYALYGCTGLTSVIYLESKLKWSRMSCGSSCITNSNITTVHCVDGDTTWWN